MERARESWAYTCMAMASWQPDAFLIVVRLIMPRTAFGAVTVRLRGSVHATIYVHAPPWRLVFLTGGMHEMPLNYGRCCGPTWEPCLLCCITCCSNGTGNFPTVWLHPASAFSALACSCVTDKQDIIVFQWVITRQDVIVALGSSTLLFFLETEPKALHHQIS
jgi:hypothetical protein